MYETLPATCARSSWGIATADGHGSGLRHAGRAGQGRASYGPRRVSYAFCGHGCRERFTKTQRHICISPPPSTPTGEGVYTCPVIQKVEHAGHGACPTCRYGIRTQSGQGAENHHTLYLSDASGGHSRTAGICPKCGMALEPTIVTAAERGRIQPQDMTRRFWVAPC